MHIDSMDELLKQATYMRKAYAKICYQALSEYRFSPSEINILIFLSRNKKINTSKELVMYLGISKSLVARSVDSLIKRELIEIQEDDKDKRIQHLVLTKQSELLVKKMKQCHDKFTKLMSEGVDKKDMETVSKVYNQMHANLEKVLEGEKEL